MILVGLWCIQPCPIDRPPMSRVVEMMEGSLDALESPPNPSMHISTGFIAESSSLSDSGKSVIYKFTTGLLNLGLNLFQHNFAAQSQSCWFLFCPVLLNLPIVPETDFSSGFAYVPNLAIDDSVFLHPEEGKREKDEILQSFIDFVDRVLTLQGSSPIKKFSLKCKTVDEEDHVRRWICNVLQRGVLDLDLFIHGEKLVCRYLPLEIFSRILLVKLKLRSEGALSWWEDTLLPMLKTLVIDSYSISGNTLETIQNSLPVLEELYLAIKKWINSEVTVSKASLRKLTISANGCFIFLNPKGVSFDTPSLVYFEYSDYVAKDYLKVNFPSLVKARINLSLSEYHFKNNWLEDDDDRHVSLRFGNVWKLISGLRNVEELFLTPNTLQVLSLCKDKMPVCNNLKSLVIESDMDRGWQAMPVLLRNCPHLETLVLEGLLHYETDKCGNACACVSRDDKGRSLISCPVKKLQIKRFEGKDRELEMIKHFLESFKCLKEMEIYSEENSLLLFKDPKTFELLVKLFKFYDLVYTCHVKFLVCSPF